MGVKTIKPFRGVTVRGSVREKTLYFNNGMAFIHSIHTIFKICKHEPNNHFGGQRKDAILIECRCGKVSEEELWTAFNFQGRTEELINNFHIKPSIQFSIRISKKDNQWRCISSNRRLEEVLLGIITQKKSNKLDFLRVSLVAGSWNQPRRHTEINPSHIVRDTNTIDYKNNRRCPQVKISDKTMASLQNKGKQHDIKNSCACSFMDTVCHFTKKVLNHQHSLQPMDKKTHAKHTSTAEMIVQQKTAKCRQLIPRWLFRIFSFVEIQTHVRLDAADSRLYRFYVDWKVEDAERQVMDGGNDTQLSPAAASSLASDEESDVHAKKTPSPSGDIKEESNTKDEDEDDDATSDEDDDENAEIEQRKERIRSSIECLDSFLIVWHAGFLIGHLSLLVLGVMLNGYFFYFIERNVKSSPNFVLYSHFVKLEHIPPDIQFGNLTDVLGKALIIISGLYIVCTICYMTFLLHKITFTIPLVVIVTGAVVLTEVNIINIYMSPVSAANEESKKNLKEQAEKQYKVDDDNDFSVTYDLMSIWGGCCGIVDQYDFQNVILKFYLPTKKEQKTLQVPPTCCKPESFEKGVEEVVECASTAEGINTIGCYSYLYQWLRRFCNFYSVVVIMQLADLTVHIILYKKHLSLLILQEASQKE